jgi:hypothetical protein
VGSYSQECWFKQMDLSMLLLPTPAPPANTSRYSSVVREVVGSGAFLKQACGSMDPIDQPAAPMLAPETKTVL